MIAIPGSARGGRRVGRSMLVALGLQMIWWGSMAAALTSTEVLERMQERFTGYRSFSARFEKHFTWAALDRSSSRQGRIHMRRPDQFRLELDDGSLVVADGQAIWSYSSRNQQAVVSPYHEEFQTPWEVLLDYRAQFVPIAIDEVSLGKHACYLLTLQPESQTSTVAQMRVWVDRKQLYLRQVEQRETSGNLITYTLSDVRTNHRLEDSLFRFAAPDGTEIIDRRPQSAPAEQ